MCIRLHPMMVVSRERLLFDSSLIAPCSKRNPEGQGLAAIVVIE